MQDPDRPPPRPGSFRNPFMLPDTPREFFFSNADRKSSESEHQPRRKRRPRKGLSLKAHCQQLFSTLDAPRRKDVDVRTLTSSHRSRAGSRCFKQVSALHCPPTLSLPPSQLVKSRIHPPFPHLWLHPPGAARARVPSARARTRAVAGAIAPTLPVLGA